MYFYITHLPSVRVHFPSWALRRSSRSRDGEANEETIPTINTVLEYFRLEPSDSTFFKTTAPPPPQNPPLYGYVFRCFPFL